MVDANWPPFPLSSAQMKRSPFCDGACHNLIRQIKKLSAVTLSSFPASALSAIMIIFLQQHRGSTLTNTIFKRGWLLWMWSFSHSLCVFSGRSSVNLQSSKKKKLLTFRFLYFHTEYDTWFHGKNAHEITQFDHGLSTAGISKPRSVDRYWSIDNLVLGRSGIQWQKCTFFFFCTNLLH